MKRIILAVIVGFAVLAQVSAESEGWVYILRNDSVEVSAPATGEIVYTIALPSRDAGRIHPTPGGKFVFITYKGRSDITVIDVETHEVAGSQSFDFEPAHIQFSSMGEKAFITNDNDNQVRIYDHRQAQFTYSGVVSVGTAGTPVMLNRRATRLYRVDSNELKYVYLKTGEVIDTVETQGELGSIAISPDYRAFWAVDKQTGYVTVIDEARARIARQVELPQRSVSPVFFDSMAVFLGGDGRYLNFFNDRNHRLARTVDIGVAAEEFVITNGGTVFIRSDAGIVTMDLENGERLATVDIPDAIGITYVVVRSGEGYACF